MEKTKNDVEVDLLVMATASLDEEIVADLKVKDPELNKKEDDEEEDEK